MWCWRYISNSKKDRSSTVVVLSNISNRLVCSTDWYKVMTTFGEWNFYILSKDIYVIIIFILLSLLWPFSFPFHLKSKVNSLSITLLQFLWPVFEGIITDFSELNNFPSPKLKTAWLSFSINCLLSLHFQNVDLFRVLKCYL